MPTRPRYFQLSIFLLLLYVILDRSGFALVPRYLPTIGILLPSHEHPNTYVEPSTSSIMSQPMCVSSYFALCNTLPVWMFLGTRNLISLLHLGLEYETLPR